MISKKMKFSDQSNLYLRLKRLLSPRYRTLFKVSLSYKYKNNFFGFKYVLFKKLKKFREIKHCFFTRKGGFSKGFCKSLNCGRGSMDFKNNINRNLRYVSKKWMSNHTTSF